MEFNANHKTNTPDNSTNDPLATATSLSVVCTHTFHNLYRFGAIDTLKNLNSYPNITHLKLTVRDDVFGSFSDASDILQHNTTLTSLDFSSNQINPDEYFFFSRLIDTNTILQYLNLSNIRNGTFRDGLDNVIPLTLRSPSLTQLDLSGNEITDDIGFAIARNTTLTSLSLRNIKSPIQYDIPTYLSLNTTLTYLDLSENKLADSIHTYIKDNTTLKNLNLSNTHKLDNVICNVSYNSTLTHLDFSGNHISNPEVYCIVSNLSELNESGVNQIKLTHLTLNNIKPAPYGMSMLANNLNNIMVQRLDLLGQNLNDIGNTLAENFEKNTYLTSLNVDNNGSKHYYTIECLNIQKATCIEHLSMQQISTAIHKYAQLDNLNNGKSKDFISIILCHRNNNFYEDILPNILNHYIANAHHTLKAAYQPDVSLTNLLHAIQPAMNEIRAHYTKNIDCSIM